MHTFEQILLCNSLKYSKAFRGKCKKLIQNIQKIIGEISNFSSFWFVDDLTPNKCTIATKLITFSPSNQSGAFISDRNPSLSFPPSIWSYDAQKWVQKETKRRKIMHSSLQKICFLMMRYLLTLMLLIFQKTGKWREFLLSFHLLVNKLIFFLSN